MVLLAEEFAAHDTSWGGELHLSALPVLLRRPVQVWRRAGPGRVVPIYGDAPHGHDEFGTAADGAYLYPANLLYSRDRDAGIDAPVGSSAAVDAGGHYDILARLS